MDLLANIKKSVASVALAAMAFGIVPNVSAALGFTDDAEIPSWAEEAIEELMDQGVLSGNDDGSFAPNRQLNRAEVSKVIVLASGIDLDTTGGPHFPDVAEDAWFYDYIETMYNYGWVNGYPDGMFRPGVGINRAEIAKMVVNAFEIDQDLSGAPHFDDVTSGDWYYGYVETAYNNGLMRGYGDGTFGPANAVTRAETSLIVYNGQLVVAEPDGPAEGTLEAVLSSDTPRGTNVPFNATSVPYTTVEFTASDDSDVEISSVTFTRLGLGDNDDFDNVWIEIDGFKVGNDKSVNNDDIVELRFNPPVVVPAGQTIVSDVVASAKYNVAANDKNVGHHNRFALVSADDIASTAANVVGDFPIEGEEMEVADYEVSQLKFSTLGSDTTVDVGDNFIEIGKFRILNSSGVNKDVELRALTFKNDGTAELEDVLENAALYVSGEQVSAETIIDGDYITFRLDNGVTGGYVIEDGDSRIFSLRADIVSAEKGDTIKFKIDNFEDVVGVEIGTSFGVKAISDNSGYVGTDAEDLAATLREYSVDSGDLNVSRDPSSLGNQEYAPGSNDVVALTARIVVDQPLLVDGIYVNVAANSTIVAGVTLANFNAAFDNFRLYLNDKLIDSENDFSYITGTTEAVSNYRLDFNTTFEIAGTSILKLVMNVQDASVTGDKLKLKVQATDFQSPEYISTGDQVTTTQLLGSAEGSFVEVKKSTLVITETSGLSNGDKIVAGVDDVTFMKFVLDNNDSGDVNVTSVTVTADDTNLSGKARTFSNFTLAIFVDGTQQGSAKNLSTTGAATFNDLSVVIPSAAQKEFVVVVDTIEASAGDKTHVSTTSGTATNAGDAIAAAQLTLANWRDFTDNTSVRIVDTAGSDDITCLVNGTATTAATVAFDTCTETATGVLIAADKTLTAATTTLTTTTSKLKLDVTAVDADNVENGQTVVVFEGGTTVGTHELDAGNTLVGTLFELVTSGRLSVTSDTTVYGTLLVAGQQNAEVLKVRFNAADDDVQIKDLYFVNSLNPTADRDALDTGETTVGDRVDFKLYNNAGQLIQEKQMTAGELHFELANQDRIRVPKDDSTFVTVKVDVRDINKANQTGSRLLLSLDTDGDATTIPYKGVEAVTAATGDDIAVPTAGWGDITGDDFVAYRTQIELRHAATQPSFQNPSSTAQEMYRFTVSADAARQAEIGRAAFETSLSGMKWENTGTVLINDAANYAIGDTALTVDASATFTVGDIVIFGGDVISTITAIPDGTHITVVALEGTVADDDPITILPAAIKQVKDNGEVDGTAVVTTGLKATGSTTTKAVFTVDFSNQKLSGSESRTYALEFGATVDDASARSDDDAVTVDIVEDTAYVAAAARATHVTTGYNIIWSDESSTSHSDITLDWLNGYLLEVDSTAKVNND